MFLRCTTSQQASFLSHEHIIFFLKQYKGTFAMPGKNAFSIETVSYLTL
jgi:hypothetical protein